MRNIFICLFGLLLGISVSFFLMFSGGNNTLLSSVLSDKTAISRQVIGFLPFWSIGVLRSDYAEYLTTLAYFSLTIDTDGKIKKLTTPVEEDPGWYTLGLEKTKKILSDAKEKNITLSLVVFNGEGTEIRELMKEPVSHAENLVEDVTPILIEYGFSDLNIDIESTTNATFDERAAFTLFITEVKKKLAAKGIKSVTIDISPSDLIKERLITPSVLGEVVDQILIMGYDYHFSGSFVTGPVSPIRGAESVSEFDIDTAVQIARKNIPAEKLILGIPLYGYEWETIEEGVRSAVIPGSGVIASNKRVEEFLLSCGSCQRGYDQEAEEPFVTYFDTERNVYHHIFYPDEKATKEKVMYAEQMQLGGLAVWALGFEGLEVMSPLRGYR